MRDFIKDLYYLIFRLSAAPMRLFFDVKVAKTSMIQRNVMLRKVQIGDYCYIAHFSSVVNAIIENYVSIGPGVVIGGAEHDINAFSTSLKIAKVKTTMLTEIDSDVWIGAGAVIRSGVKIGRGAVIGANSVVTKNVRPYSVVMGCPASHRKYRFDSKVITLLEDTKWWLKKPKHAKRVLKTIPEADSSRRTRLNENC